jgi:hypothetical protein
MLQHVKLVLHEIQDRHLKSYTYKLQFRFIIPDVKVT